MPYATGSTVICELVDGPADGLYIALSRLHLHVMVVHVTVDGTDYVYKVQPVKDYAPAIRRYARYGSDLG